MANNYRLAINRFSRWIVMHPDDDFMAWTGQQWAAIDDNGFPAGDYQISNFDSREEADIYAKGQFPESAPASENVTYVPNVTYVTCTDCGAQYEAGQPHQMFCEARTCEECQRSFSYVIEKGIFQKDRRICEECNDRANFPEG